MMGISAYADVSPTNETNAAVAAVSTNGTNAVAEAVDEMSALTPKEQVERCLLEFAKSKGDGFKYGVLNEKADEIYYAAISPVFSVGTNDTRATVRQMAFNRAFTGILLRRAMATFAYSASFDSPDGGVAGGILTEDDPGVSAAERIEFPVPGMSAEKTCVCVSADGKLVVGVIVKADSPRDDVACRAAEGVRPSIERKEGVPFKKLLDVTDDQLAMKFGTAFYYNEKGEPELMSFGHWSIGAAPDSNSRAKCEAKAFAQAEAAAQDSLSTFLSGVVSARIMRDKGLFGKQTASWTFSSRARSRGVQLVARKVLRLSTGEEEAFVALRLPVWSFPKERPEQKAEPAKAGTTDKQYDY